MPYIDELILIVTAEFSLSPEKQQELKQLMKVEGIQELLENKHLDVHTLIKGSADKVCILSPAKAEVLVAQYQEMKALEPFKQGLITLADAVLWIESENEFYPYLLSLSGILQLAKDREQTPELIKRLKEVKNARSQWEEIKQEAALLNNIPRHQMSLRKRNAQALMLKLLALVNTASQLISNPIINAEYGAISKNLTQYIEGQLEPIDEAARYYFSTVFAGYENVEFKFFHKQSGDQLGRKMVASYQTPFDKAQHQISFFIKTHQYGSTSRQSSAKPVDPKELFIYKVLEYTGLGPKVHFFFSPLSSNSFFIATQDAGFTKVTGKFKVFEIYEKIKAGFDSKFLTEMKNIPSSTESAITAIDLFCRVFRLRDVTTNATNFGRVTINQNLEKWKIIDFRIETDIDYLADGIYESWRLGNGMYNYHGFFGYLLRDRPESERILAGKEALEKFEQGQLSLSTPNRKLSLVAAMEKAFWEVSRFIFQESSHLAVELKGILGKLSSLPKEGLTQERFLAAWKDEDREQVGDLGRYVKDCQRNFQCLQGRFNEEASIGPLAVVKD